MRKLSKTFLLIGGVFGLIGTAVLFSALIFFSTILSGAGIGMLASNYGSIMEAMSDPSVELNMTLIIAGVAALLANGVLEVVVTANALALLLMSILSLLSMSVFGEKRKAIFIIDIIVSGLLLLSAIVHSGLLMGFIALIVLLGAIFGLAALKKEKKTEEEPVQEEPVEEVK